MRKRKHQVYGYVRVSTQEQNEARQLRALSSFSIKSENIYMDKKSGKDFLRPGWKELIEKIGPGDLLVIKSIDRLGRNYEEILEQWKLLTKEIQANIVVLDMPLLDTRAKGNDLTGTFIADLVLQILSYVAQTERENIRQRQQEGIAMAKANGTHFGRDLREIPNFDKILKQYNRKEITVTEAATKCGLSRQGFYKRVRALQEEAERKKKA